MLKCNFSKANTSRAKAQLFAIKEMFRVSSALGQLVRLYHKDNSWCELKFTGFLYIIAVIKNLDKNHQENKQKLTLHH